MNAPEQWVGTFVPIQNQSNRAHRFENAGQCFRLVVFLRVFGFVWVGLSLSLSLSRIHPIAGPLRPIPLQ